MAISVASYSVKTRWTSLGGQRMYDRFPGDHIYVYGGMYKGYSSMMVNRAFKYSTMGYVCDFPLR